MTTNHTDLIRRLYANAQGVELGADGMGWSPDPALYREAADALEAMQAENFKLAAGQCANVTADEGGRPYCKEIESLRARLEAMQAEQPSVRDDGMPASKDERHLRRLLAGCVNMLHTYYDDGEVQGEEHGISIDFMREPAAGIAAKLRELGVARYKCEQPSVREPLTDKQIGMAVYNCDYFSSDTLKIARAIERAHGIGVKGEA